MGNLPEGVSRQDVEDVFGSVGDIVEVRMMTNYAFVEYHKLQVSEDDSGRLPV